MVTNFTDIANSLSSTTVVKCKDYECSYGYEYKSGYDSITCKDDCDDYQCCDKGGCVFRKRCTITAYYALHRYQTYYSALGVGSLLQRKNPIVVVHRLSFTPSDGDSVALVVRAYYISTTCIL